uniref:Uncharacterized protein n=1 Tax=Heliothis virescens TaxID=7102 RepID=A0A2A4JKN5_HELVI
MPTCAAPRAPPPPSTSPTSVPVSQRASREKCYLYRAHHAHVRGAACPAAAQHQPHLGACQPARQPGEVLPVSRAPCPRARRRVPRRRPAPAPPRCLSASAPAGRSVTCIARTMPTCAAPRAPPPPSTSPTSVPVSQRASREKCYLYRAHHAHVRGAACPAAAQHQPHLGACQPARQPGEVLPVSRAPCPRARRRVPRRRPAPAPPRCLSASAPAGRSVTCIARTMPTCAAPRAPPPPSTSPTSVPVSQRASREKCYLYRAHHAHVRGAACPAAAQHQPHLGACQPARQPGEVLPVSRAPCPRARRRVPRRRPAPAPPRCLSASAPAGRSVTCIARTMPTCAAPRAPPPPSTSPTSVPVSQRASREKCYLYRAHHAHVRGAACPAAAQHQPHLGACQPARQPGEVLPVSRAPCPRARRRVPRRRPAPAPPRCLSASAPAGRSVTCIARTMPTCAAPRAPPPPSTSPTSVPVSQRASREKCYLYRAHHAHVRGAACPAAAQHQPHLGACQPARQPGEVLPVSRAPCPRARRRVPRRRPAPAPPRCLSASAPAGRSVTCIARTMPTCAAPRAPPPPSTSPTSVPVSQRASREKCYLYRAHHAHVRGAACPAAAQHQPHLGACQPARQPGEVLPVSRAPCPRARRRVPRRRPAPAPPRCLSASAPAGRSVTCIARTMPTCAAPRAPPPPSTSPTSVPVSQRASREKCYLYRAHHAHVRGAACPAAAQHQPHLGACQPARQPGEVLPVSRAPCPRARRRVPRRRPAPAPPRCLSASAPAGRSVTCIARTMPTCAAPRAPPPPSTSPTSVPVSQRASREKCYLYRAHHAHVRGAACPAAAQHQPHLGACQPARQPGEVLPVSRAPCPRARRRVPRRRPAPAPPRCLSASAPAGRSVTCIARTMPTCAAPRAPPPPSTSPTSVPVSQRASREKCYLYRAHHAHVRGAACPAAAQHQPHLGACQPARQPGEVLPVSRAPCPRARRRVPRRRPAPAPPRCLSASAPAGRSVTCIARTMPTCAAPRAPPPPSTSPTSVPVSQRASREKCYLYRAHHAHVRGAACPAAAQHQPHLGACQPARQPGEVLPVSRAPCPRARRRVPRRRPAPAPPRCLSASAPAGRSVTCIARTMPTCAAPRAPPPPSTSPTSVPVSQRASREKCYLYRAHHAHVRGAACPAAAQHQPHLGACQPARQPGEVLPVSRAPCPRARRRVPRRRPAPAPPRCLSASAPAGRSVTCIARTMPTCAAPRAPPPPSTSPTSVPVSQRASREKCYLYRAHHAHVRGAACPAAAQHQPHLGACQPARQPGEVLPVSRAPCPRARRRVPRRRPAPAPPRCLSASAPAGRSVTCIARTMPTCAAPRAPPPPSTSPTSVPVSQRASREKCYLYRAHHAHVRGAACPAAAQHQPHLGACQPARQPGEVLPVSRAPCPRARRRVPRRRPAPAPLTCPSASGLVGRSPSAPTPPTSAPCCIARSGNVHKSLFTI